MIINLVLFFIPKRQEIYRLYLIKKRKKLAYMMLNSKKAICTTGWENGNAKSIFEIFSPTSPNGIYSYYNIKDIPFYHSPTDAYVTIIKGHELIIVFAEQNILITGSSRNIWTKKWHSINLSILS